MVRPLTNLVSGLGLAVLLAVSVVCLQDVGFAMLSPIAAPEPWLPPRPSRASATDPPAVPMPFEPSALFTQPVFAITRMPPQPSAPPAETPVAASPSPPSIEVAPPNYVLAGIMISAVEQKVLLKNHKTEKGFWISRGQNTRDGWTVLTVKPDKVTLGKSTSQFMLQFRSFVQCGQKA